MATIPHQSIRQGNLFIVPVGSSVSEVPYPVQSVVKPPDYSQWVHGQIQEPGAQLDRARMSTRLYQEVRCDVTRYAPVEVTRSAFRRSQHAYVGVIDSRGTPYYFALDSRGVSVREADPNDDRVWKTFEQLAGDEHTAAVRQRRSDSADEMRVIDRELSEPALVVIAKARLRYGKKADWKHDAPGSSWWRTRSPKKPAVEPESTEKALPRKSKEAEVKKTPSGKASKKQAGAGGKTRYTYPQEKKASPNGGPVPLVIVHDDTRHADPAELANQLGVSVRTLQRCARRLGSDGFGKFMRAHLKRFAAKHRLDPDYWRTLYAALAATDGGPIAKSESDEAAWKKFGDHVNLAARAVPHDHPERFGDHKVFIHHVHHEMVRHGLYGGSLGEFKGHLEQARKRGHVSMSRADLVGAMNPRSVAQSESEHKVGGISVGTAHFVSDAKHDLSAAKTLAAMHSTAPGPKQVSTSPAPAEPKKPRARAKPSGAHHDAARAASESAHAASAHAERAGTSEAHLAAMSAHHSAGAAHQKATGKVSNKESMQHFDQSMRHLSAAKAKS